MPVPSFEAPKRLLLRDQVQQQIRTAILDGTLQPGERLHDDDLISWLGVSRTPIREALTALAKEGLVEMVPKRYTRVANPSPDDARNAVHALGILLAGIVWITLPTITERQRQQVLQRVDRRIAELKTGGTKAIVRTADESYQAWLELCPNRALAEVVRQSAGGFAFACRIDTIDQIIPVDTLIRHLSEYRNAVAVGDTITAVRAIDVAHTPSAAPLATFAA